MLVVTGSMRTGTSLVMQTLKLLGVYIVGMDFHPKYFQHVDLNHKGYWELPPSEVIDGIKTHKYRGMAVKLFPVSLCMTDPRFIYKLIICRRGSDEAIKSSKRLLRRDGWMMNVCQEDAPNIYDLSYASIRNFNKRENKPVLNVQFENMIRYPKETIQSIKKFIGSTENIVRAVDNVDRKLAEV